MLRATRVAARMLLAAFCVSARLHAQAASPPLSLLDVPFISQSELLCGGAAAAMVLRYWGERGVDADAFAPLVDRSAAGIRTNALIDNLRGRGYMVSALTGTTDTLARELGRGRPVVVLIEDRPGTFHYIVLVGITDRAIVFHDPARTPFRVMSLDEFDRRWSPAERWMAIVLPEASNEAKPPAARAVEPAGGSCDGQVKRGVQQAQANQLDDAARTFTAALSCNGPAPLRELAGVRLLQKRWPEVTDLAAAALTQDPKDEQAWRLLATGRFVQDDRVGALEAWNRVGEPRVDLIAIRGLSRTRQHVAERLMDVPPQAMLTPGLFTVARRRLRDLPSVSTAQLEYVPVASGLVELRGTVSERPPIPNDRVSFAVLGTDAIFRRQIDVSFGPFTSGGDRLTLGWRFWSGRPRYSASFTVPAPWGGIWGVDAFNERQPFLGDVVPVAHRQGAHLGASLWSTHWMRTTIRTGVENWREIGEFGLVGGGLRLVTPDDRIDARLELTRWIGRSDPSFGTAEFGVTLRSTTEHRGRVWIARTGTAAASLHTPADIWFAGDTGRARGVPLRAHPVIDGGKLDPQQIGRRIQFASGEVQNWWSYRTKLQYGAAMFVDTARASQRVFPDAKADVDVGIGARFSAPGFGGVLRIDVAHGLRDGDDALSFVYEP
ncbi:MAG TPA: papain-like cysteine protease family protein [Vicinamibacterales bacterium]